MLNEILVIFKKGGFHVLQIVALYTSHFVFEADYIGSG
jgi:hypothetical protein